MNVLDAGCGEGRNLMYFLNAGNPVYGIDTNPEAIKALRFIAGATRPDLDKQNFLVGDLNSIPFPDRSFDVVLSIAVLHFAQDKHQFFQMFKELMRCVKSDGILFIQMASIMGQESKVVPHDSDRYVVPNGNILFLLTREIIEQIENTFDISYLEPLKTTMVDERYSVSTMVLSSAS